MSAAKTLKPLVLVPACNRMLGEHPFHVAGKKYVDAVRLAGCQPLVIPTLDEGDLDDLLSIADGLFLTGAPSNVHPSLFGETVHNTALPLDSDRDRTTLPLIAAALNRGIPMFAICRGFQETNVALGGSLHQAVQEVAERNDHRAPSEASAEVQYALAHPVNVLPDGTLARILGAGPVEVNSVHGQGVNRLADGLRVEALAPDGLIEAFSKPDAPGFNLCVQWHPEWQAASNPVSVKLFKAFGAACAAYRDRRRPPQRDPDR